MKWIKTSLLVLIALGSVSAGSAWADRGFHGSGFHGGYHGGHFYGPRVGFGLYVDPFPLFYGPAYYGPGYYSYPDVVVSSAPTTVYMEPSGTISGPSYGNAPAGAQQPGQSSDWYYCNKPDGYYPSVKSCPGGWQRVPQTPPDAR